MRCDVYFKRAYDALKDDGVFFCDMFGGPEAQEETKEKTKHKSTDFPISGIRPNFTRLQISFAVNPFPFQRWIEDQEGVHLRVATLVRAGIARIVARSRI